MELMGKCRTLWEYMIFVSKVREYSRGMPLSQAMEKAVAGAIKENILADFLRKNRAEVIKVGIYEYNEELHIQQEREDVIQKRTPISGGNRREIYYIMLNRKYLKMKNSTI